MPQSRQKVKEEKRQRWRERKRERREKAVGDGKKMWERAAMVYKGMQDSAVSVLHERPPRSFPDGSWQIHEIEHAANQAVSAASTELACARSAQAKIS
eukprot:757681-Hanusia_phi.AAC.3